MNKIELTVGSERDFSGFIMKLNEKEKVALISHTDLDGLVSAKIVDKVVDADIVEFVDYEELNDKLIEKLKKKKARYIIFTDLLIKDANFIKEIEKFADILIIDHHPFQIDFNSSKTAFLNCNGIKNYCASYLCYYLFYKIENLEKFDWLAACASVADFCFIDNADWMQNVYNKYGDEYFVENGKIRKEGKIWDLMWKLTLILIYYEKNLKKVFDAINERFGEVGGLDKKAVEVQKDIDQAVELFEKKKQEIKEGYFLEIESKFRIKSIVSNIISVKYWDKTIILGKIEGDRYYLSARRQDWKRNIGELLEKLTSGLEGANAGGHIAAAGASFLLKDREKFLRRLRDL